MRPIALLLCLSLLSVVACSRPPAGPDGDKTNPGGPSKGGQAAPIAALTQHGAKIEKEGQPPDERALKLYFPDPDVKVTDTELEQIGKLTGLQELQLDKAQITDAGLAHLKGLKGLQVLVLSNTGVGDAGLAHLTGLDKLETLVLYRTRITDAGLASLKGMKNLKELQLGGNPKITDAGLEHLMGLAGLRELRLNLTEVTDAGVEKLKTALPKLDVKR
jgi:Leucine-rich repeat (LRR) protein